jgi:hypothetical protein
MADILKLTRLHRPWPVMPLIALALLLGAWSASCLGQYRSSHLDLSRFGPCEEVCEALAKDDYVGHFQLPYFTTAALLDGLAVMMLLAAGAFGQFRLLGVLVATFAIPSAAWHLLGLLFSSLPIL